MKNILKAVKYGVIVGTIVFFTLEIMIAISYGINTLMDSLTTIMILLLFYIILFVDFCV